MTHSWRSVVDYAPVLCSGELFPSLLLALSLLWHSFTHIHAPIVHLSNLLTYLADMLGLVNITAVLEYFFSCGLLSCLYCE